MEQNQKTMLGILLVSGFIFLATVLVFVYSVPSMQGELPWLFQLFISHHVEFMVLMGLFGVLSGAVAYSMMSRTIERQKNAAKASLEILAKFMSKDDAGTIRLMLGKGGMTTQSEIAKSLGVSRLRAHRICRRLEERGIIHVERHGKINLLRIVDELKQE